MTKRRPTTRLIVLLMAVVWYAAEIGLAQNLFQINSPKFKGKRAKLTTIMTIDCDPGLSRGWVWVFLTQPDPEITRKFRF